MRKITITCDYCDRDITDSDSIVELGSTNGQDLKFSSHDKKLARFHDLHFCTKEHLILYLFGPEAKQPTYPDVEFKK